MCEQELGDFDFAPNDYGTSNLFGVFQMDGTIEWIYPAYSNLGILSVGFVPCVLFLPSPILLSFLILWMIIGLRLVTVLTVIICVVN